MSKLRADGKGRGASTRDFDEKVAAPSGETGNALCWFRRHLMTHVGTMMIVDGDEKSPRLVHYFTMDRFQEWQFVEKRDGDFLMELLREGRNEETRT